MPIIIPANSAAGGGGYEVTNSARFNPASNDRLTRTPSSDGSRVKWTWSCWAKRGTDNQDLYLFGAYQNSSYNTFLKFASGGEIRFADVYGGSEQARINTLAKFRDPSAWYHIVVVYDKDNSTSTDRLIMYVNGVRITQFDGSTMSSQSTTFNTANIQVQIGALNGDGDMNGYMSEICFVNNQALAPTSFGEFDEDSGIWKPIESVADLTFGTNGFYMDFKDSSELGNDAAGSNNYAEVNMTALNQSTDTCTLNGCTMNPLSNYWTNGAEFSFGNLQINTNTSGKAWNMSTIGLPSGKWYMEGKYTATGGSAPSDNWNRFGIVDREPTSNSDLGASANAYALTQYDGSKYVNGTNSTYAAAWAIGDVIAMAIDLDNNKIYWSKNGAWGNGSGAWGSTTFNAGTGAVTVVDPTLTLNGEYFVAMGDAGVSVKKTWQFNFGSPPYAISSGNQDDNDYGNFEYEVPSGFLTINSANLSEVLS